MGVILLYYIVIILLYYTMKHLLKSKLLSRKTKDKLYTTYLRPAVSYACCTWATIAGDENRLNIFERNVK